MSAPGPASRSLRGDVRGAIPAWVVTAVIVGADAVMVARNPGDIDRLLINAILALECTCMTDRLDQIRAEIGALLPDMFGEFMVPILTEMTERVNYCMYHWDGPSAIPHHDHLLSIPRLSMLQWTPGAGGMGLHTILLDATNEKRIYIAISAAGTFRSDDGGQTWRPINKGLRSPYMPDQDAEVGHCVHHVAMHRAKPEVLFMQKHWDVMRSDDAGENWHEVSGNLPTDFGFVIDVHAHEPETLYVVPIKSDSEHFPIDGKLRVYRSRSGGNEWEPLAKGLPEKDCYVNVLRDAMAVDRLDECGVYFGTTGGQVYASADAGDNWMPIVRDLPAVLSVEVQTMN